MRARRPTLLRLAAHKVDGMGWNGPGGMEMEKSSRLRWIPMLLKAYVDAQVRQELHASQRGPGFRLPEGADTLPTPPGRSRPDARRFPRGTTAGPTKRTTQRPPARPKPPSFEGMNSSYQTLVRELRETRERLTRIEELQRELEQMRRLLSERASSVPATGERADVDGRENQIAKERGEETLGG